MSLCLLAALVLSTPAPATPSPKAQLSSSLSEVRAIVKSASTIADKQNRLHRITSSYIDFDRLAQETLDTEWDKLPSAQRKEFATVLKELIEGSYINKLSESATVDLNLGDEKVSGDSATVEGTAHVKGSDVALVFSLRLTPKQWMFDDVELDEVSLRRNYRSQFLKTIARDGYAGLVAKLRKKVAEFKSVK